MRALPAIDFERAKPNDTRCAESAQQAAQNQWVRIGRIRTSAPLKGDCDTIAAGDKPVELSDIRTSAPLKGDCDVVPLDACRRGCVIRTSAPLKGDCDIPPLRTANVTTHIRTSAPLKGDCDNRTSFANATSVTTNPNECAAQRRLRLRMMSLCASPVINPNECAAQRRLRLTTGQPLPLRLANPNECAAQRRLRQVFPDQPFSPCMHIRTSAPLKGDCDFTDICL